MLGWIKDKVEAEIAAEKQKLIKREEEVAIKEVRLKVSLELADAYARGHEQRSNYECEWHREREKKVVELTKLDAEISAKKIQLETYRVLASELLEEKDARIKGLEAIVASLLSTIDSSTKYPKELLAKCIEYYREDKTKEPRK
jgi:hypothetical protein